MATMAYSVVGDDVVVFVAGVAEPPAAEWQDYQRRIDPLARRIRSNNGTIRFLVIADEGGPNAKQRAAIADMLHGIPTRTAVVSNSMMIRRMITAFGWLNFAMKGFAPGQITAAGAYLDLSGEQLEAVVGRAATLAQSIGGVRCVDAAVAALRSGGTPR